MEWFVCIDIRSWNRMLRLSVKIVCWNYLSWSVVEVIRDQLQKSSVENVCWDYLLWSAVEIICCCQLLRVVWCSARHHHSCSMVFAQPLEPTTPIDAQPFRCPLGVAHALRPGHETTMRDPTFTKTNQHTESYVRGQKRNMMLNMMWKSWNPNHWQLGEAIQAHTYVQM